MTGFLVIAILVTGLFLIVKKNKGKNLQATPMPTPSIENRVIDKFGGLVIPKDLDRADLKDVSGGNSVGIATRKYENGKFELTVLADVPAPAEGYFYQTWLVNGKIFESGAKIISVSKLRAAKGGYLSELTTSENYSGFPGVVVTLEKTFDQTPEKQILEGSF